MTKSDRLNLIAMIAGNMHKAPVLAASASDLSEEISLARNPLDNDESILESEYNYEPSVELISQLADGEQVEEARTHSRHVDGDIFTKGEREQMQKDLWTFRHPGERMLPIPISLFDVEARLTA